MAGGFVVPGGRTVGVVAGSPTRELSFVWGDEGGVGARRPVSFGPSLRDPGVERPRLREVGSGRLAAGLARSRPKYTDLLGKVPRRTLGDSFWRTESRDFDRLPP
jgi:hypothetical protein